METSPSVPSTYLRIPGESSTSEADEQQPFCAKEKGGRGVNPYFPTTVFLQSGEGRKEGVVCFPLPLVDLLTLPYWLPAKLRINPSTLDQET